jgi:hypothetical protein
MSSSNTYVSCSCWHSQKLRCTQAKLLITLQLVLSSDMKSACLACKRFQVFFTPLLYRHMEIYGDYVLDESFARSLTENHHGLKHVRTLRIRDPKTLMDICELSGRTIPRTLYPEYNIIEEQMGRAICRFLDAMPTHSLTRLE